MAFIDGLPYEVEYDLGLEENIRQLLGRVLPKAQNVFLDHLTGAVVEIALQFGAHY